MGAILASLLKQKATGQIMGLLVSKTQLGATLGGGAALWAVLPRALESDPEAVGQVVLIMLGWLGALYGRWKAKPAPLEKKKK